MKLLAFVVVYLAVASAALCEQVVLRAVRDRDAILPCGQGKVFLDGPDSYLVWMKEKEVLFRYPNEESIRSSSIQTLDHIYGQCNEKSCVDPTSLQLKRVGEQDGGIYLCRVHYQASPTVDFVIELRVIEGPEKPNITMSEGVEINGNIGQLELGANMSLTCAVCDRSENTHLWWERNGLEVARAKKRDLGMLKTMVRVYYATRNEVDAHYVCVAQNSEVSQPLTTSLVIKMNLPPTSVQIRTNNNLHFEVGQPRIVDCLVVGCVPPPVITWHMAGKMIRPSVHKEIHDGNFSISTLSLAMSQTEDKHELICRAQNLNIPAKVFEDKVTVSVGFRPFCIKEHEVEINFVKGQKESITCILEANPAPIQFSWTFPDNTIMYTIAQRMSDPYRHSSVLTWTPTENQQGTVLCRAINVHGVQRLPCSFPIVKREPPSTPHCDLNTDPADDNSNCRKAQEKSGVPRSLLVAILGTAGVVIFLWILATCARAMHRNSGSSGEDLELSAAMMPDGRFQRQEDPSYRQRTQEITNIADHSYIRTPCKAAKMLGIMPTHPSVKFGEPPEQELVTYFV